jgi:hypothetical protein
MCSDTDIRKTGSDSVATDHLYFTTVQDLFLIYSFKQKDYFHATRLSTGNLCFIFGSTLFYLVLFTQCKQHTSTKNCCSYAGYHHQAKPSTLYDIL